MRRLAVVLFNLGGPDGPEAVEAVPINLFSDPAIIRVPSPWRWLLGPVHRRAGAANWPKRTTPGSAADRRSCPTPRAKPRRWRPPCRPGPRGPGVRCHALLASVLGRDGGSRRAVRARRNRAAAALSAIFDDHDGLVAALPGKRPRRRPGSQRQAGASAAIRRNPGSSQPWRIWRAKASKRRARARPESRRCCSRPMACRSASSRRATPT